MRKYTTGATRNDDKERPEFGGFLSPIVVRRFGEYMHKNRLQKDGTLRASDNWKKGMARRDYFESLFRHFIDVWEEITNDKDQETTLNYEDDRILQEALCAILFNAQGLLREVLLGRDVGKDLPGVQEEKAKDQAVSDARGHTGPLRDALSDEIR